uniref:Protein sprouty homolog 2 n=1 Tax=Scleropages formosus TaxID=113540 RepID=A0A8C9R497_SCLFO
AGRRDVGGHAHVRDAPGSQAVVLSLSQIQILGTSNEYTEGPVVAPRPVVRPATGQMDKQKMELTQGQVEEDQDQVVLSGPHNEQDLCSLPSPASSTQSTSTVGSDSRSVARLSSGSTSSGQRLLESSPAQEAVGTQPKSLGTKVEELKSFSAPEPGGHNCRCEDCGRCTCTDCTRPRVLPSCWVCDRRCICSAQTLVDYATCVCCVKCIFYHCSSDDEDVCADDPCSCSQSRCCIRWTAMGFLSLFLPCMLCYLPARGCLQLCQGCHDRLKRPGCRCRSTDTVHCKTVKKPT